MNSTELLSGGATILNLKGDVSMTSVDVEAKEGSFAEQKVSSTRLRVLVSGEQQRGLASGGRLMPSVEAGGRFAGGNGLSLNLEGTQKNTTDSASHQVLLRGEVAF